MKLHIFKDPKLARHQNRWLRRYVSGFPEHDPTLYKTGKARGKPYSRASATGSITETSAGPNIGTHRRTRTSWNQGIFQSKDVPEDVTPENTDELLQRMWFGMESRNPVSERLDRTRKRYNRFRHHIKTKSKGGLGL